MAYLCCIMQLLFFLFFSGLFMSHYGAFFLEILILVMCSYLIMSFWCCQSIILLVLLRMRKIEESYRNYAHSCFVEHVEAVQLV